VNKASPFFGAEVPTNCILLSVKECTDIFIVIKKMKYFVHAFYPDIVSK
jgi:hypothetical protein